MSDYVFVVLGDSAEEGGVDLPLEKDGTLLLSVLRSQFKDASGLKYRNPSTGRWAAVRLKDGRLFPPTVDIKGKKKESWGHSPYTVVGTELSHERHSNSRSPVSQRDRDPNPKPQRSMEPSPAPRKSREHNPTLRSSMDPSPIPRKSMDPSPIPRKSMDPSPIPQRSMDPSPKPQRSRESSPHDLITDTQEKLQESAAELSELIENMKGGADQGQNLSDRDIEEVTRMRELQADVAELHNIMGDIAKLAGEQQEEIASIEQQDVTDLKPVQSAVVLKAHAQQKQNCLLC